MRSCEREEETLFEHYLKDVFVIFRENERERENNIQNIDSLNASESLVKNLSWPLLEKESCTAGWLPCCMSPCF